MVDATKLVSILLSIANELSFTAEEKALNEAREYLDCDEWGLALETLVFVVNRHLHQIPGHILQHMVWSAHQMNIKLHLTLPE
jgi:hypothetical protein